jgi:NTP pyrophosphatase (non-canonical NTP hydrolase)
MTISNSDYLQPPDDVVEQALSFDEYEAEVMPLAVYPNILGNILYPVLGLVGESGEVAEKVKKIWRNQGAVSVDEYSEEQKAELIKELGDVLWYVTATANELGTSLNHVATVNRDKLVSRGQRGVLKSEGDNR